MFNRHHHTRIARVLSTLQKENLIHSRCWFGGGTALALQLGEYRESVDIDFLCGTLEDYSALRKGVYDAQSTVRGFVPLDDPQALSALRSGKWNAISQAEPSM